VQDFDYVSARTVEEAIDCLEHGPQPVLLLSGGTDLLVQLREGRKQARLLVDIKRIDELNSLVWSPEGLWIGAAVPCWRVVSDPQIYASCPGVVEAVSLIGGTQIQSRASVGGNLCNASPAGDSIPALIVYRAICIIAGPDGRREIPVEDFCTAPGRNALAPGEILVGIRIPPIPTGFGGAYLRFIPRNEMDIAVAGAGAAMQLDESGERIEWARVALGAVAPKPLLVDAAGAYLTGREPTEANLREAARIAQEAAAPIDDMRGTSRQRKHLSMVLARRALTNALERARGAAPVGSNGHG